MLPDWKHKIGGGLGGSFLWGSGNWGDKNHLALIYRYYKKIRKKTPLLISNIIRFIFNVTSAPSSAQGMPLCFIAPVLLREKGLFMASSWF